MLGLRLREGLDWGKKQIRTGWLSAPGWFNRDILEEIHPGRWRVTETSVAFTNKVLAAVPGLKASCGIYDLQLTTYYLPLVIRKFVNDP